MTIFVCWLLFPLLLAILSLGCGAVVDAIAGGSVPGLLRIPLGLATIMVVTLAATTSGATAQLGVPAVVGLAVVGLALLALGGSRRPDGWAIGGAAAVFGIYAAPVVLYGQATFAGYIKLDDIATFNAMVDRVFHHGRSLAGLAPSTYEATLHFTVGSAYPIGSVMPLGVGEALTGQDGLWLFQPYLAFLAAMLGLVLYVLAAPLVQSRSIRALAAFVGAQSTLLFGYALWGGVKELAAAPLLALTAALAAVALQDELRVRRLVPLAIACAAMLGTLTVAGMLWLLPAGVILALLVRSLVRRSLDRAGAVKRVAGFLAVTAIVALPSLLLAGSWLSPSDPLTSGQVYGNLIQKLSVLQLFGIWPIADFRLSLPSSDRLPVYILFALVAAAAAVAGHWAWQRRGWGILLYAAGGALGCAVFVAFASPWVAAKGLATAAPILPFAAVVCCGVLFDRGRRTEAIVALAAVAGGVLWSNALAYHEVWLAPRDQLVELESIGKRFAGEGPALMTEYQPYGVRHLLRQLDPEGASELRVRTVPLVDGSTLATAVSADIDQIRLDAVLVYRTLVLRRSPAESRPPSVYRLVWSGRYYDVWQRPVVPTPIVAHLALGGSTDPGAVPSCAVIESLASQYPRGYRFAAVERKAPFFVSLSELSVPSSWATYGGDPGHVYPSGSGAVSTRVNVPVTGRYTVWVGGSWRGRLAVSVDGARTRSVRFELNHDGIYSPMGVVELGKGTHSIELSYSLGSILLPGTGNDTAPGGQYVRPLGPLALSYDSPNSPIVSVDPARARELCGKHLDWIEVLTAR
jgi:hypothetical protein